MLKKISLILLCTISSIYSFAQNEKPKEKFSIRKSLFTKLAIGYSFRTGNGRNTQQTDLSNGSNTLTTTPFSYGKGFNIDYGLGVFFNKNIGADVTMSYFIGGNNKSHNYYRMDDIDPYNVNETISERADLFKVNPSLILCTEYKRVVPYAKFGLVFGWGTGNTKIEDHIVTASGYKQNETVNWQLQGGRTFGYTSNVGIKIKSKGGLANFFFELTHTAMSGTFKKGSISQYTINGYDYTSHLTTSDKQIIFVDQLNSLSNNSASKPQQVLKNKLPFDGIGFNIGLMINLESQF